MARIRHLMAYCFEICRRKGMVFLSDNKKACMLVLAPNKSISFLLEMWLNLKVLLLSIGISNARKVIRRDRILKKLHPKGSHYYLWFLGVFPEYQNMGIGSKLINEVLSQCERDKKPIFLETSVKRNVPLYERFGFEVFKIVNVGYKMYLMIKDFKTQKEELQQGVYADFFTD